jgi:hypothetical protein
MYVDFTGDDAEDKVRASYPDAVHERLVRVKDTYDPTNLFGLNQNVRPPGSELTNSQMHHGRFPALAVPVRGGERPCVTLALVNEEVRALHERLARLEELLTAAREAPAEPAWRRPTRGESRWAVTAAVAAAVALQLLLPERLTFQPAWLLPALELLLLVALFPGWHARARRTTTLTRGCGLTLAALVSLANGWSAVLLIRGLVRGTEGNDAGKLLMAAAAIWLTNVIVFALWFWEWDRGGPAARAAGGADHTDFLFPQMQSPELGRAEWEPAFADYLYVSFTNATAFSPTDTMPLSRWAKLLMALQASISLLTLALVVARSVNIFRG